MVVGLCVCMCGVYLYVRYLDLQMCWKLSAGKRTIAIKRYFKKSNSLRFFIQGFVLQLWCDLLTSNTGCGAFQTSQTTDLLEVDLFAS